MRRLIYLFVVLLFAGCRTQYVEVPVEKVRDVYHNVTDTIHDSIYHDVFVNQYVIGDTVFRDRTEYICKDRWRVRDSIVIQIDSIPTPYKVEVEVPAQLTSWQKFLNGLGKFTLFILIIALAIVVLKVYRKLRP